MRLIRYSIVFLILFCSLQGQNNVGKKVPTEVERIYNKGIDFLINTQKSDGSWGKGRNGVVSLSVMALLGHGKNVRKGKVSQALKKAVAFLLKTQKKNGDFANYKHDYATYDHALIILALTEAYGMVDNKDLGPAIQKGIDFLLYAQSENNHKAWRYGVKDNTADTSIAGTCLMALYGARNAGFNVPKDAIGKALKWQKTCINSNGGVGYTKRGGGNNARGAITYLVLNLGNQEVDSKTKATLKYITGNNRPSGSHFHMPHYEDYYMSQALFQGDVKYWQKWIDKKVKELSSLQRVDGSWQEKNKKLGVFGVSYSTSFNLLTLALYFRYLPIYERY